MGGAVLVSVRLGGWLEYPDRFTVSSPLPLRPRHVDERDRHIVGVDPLHDLANVSILETIWTLSAVSIFRNIRVHKGFGWIHYLTVSGNVLKGHHVPIERHERLRSQWKGLHLPRRPGVPPHRRLSATHPIGFWSKHSFSLWFVIDTRTVAYS